MEISCGKIVVTLRHVPNWNLKIKDYGSQLLQVRLYLAAVAVLSFVRELSTANRSCTILLLTL